MINIKSFSKALTAFCLLVFFQFFVPESVPKVIIFLKYLTIISTILILVMYNKILEEIIISDADGEFKIEGKDDVSEIRLNRPSPKKLYEHLIEFVIQTAKSINENSISAIYVIDPNKNNYRCKRGKCY